MTESIDFTKQEEPPPNDLSRRESWPVGGVAELELSVDVGRIEVHLDHADEPEVRVEVRHDPAVGGMWAQGISGVINWIGQATGGPGTEAEDLAAEAVRAAEITWSEPGRRLVVRSSPELPLRLVPLVVTVTAPAGSRLAARTGAGDVEVTGRAGWAAVRTGSGEVDVAAVDGDTDVTTGSGDLVLGEVAGRARLRTGSGTVRLASAGGATEIKAGSGDVALGSVSGDLGVRTGSGELRIEDARAGRFDLTTGSGEIRVAVHPGVRAELDLTSGSGRARSELTVEPAPPADAVALQVRGRTGSGDVLVTRALVSA
jgi:Putative adhesin